MSIDLINIFVLSIFLLLAGKIVYNKNNILSSLHIFIIYIVLVSLFLFLNYFGSQFIGYSPQSPMQVVIFLLLSCILARIGYNLIPNNNRNTVKKFKFNYKIVRPYSLILVVLGIIVWFLIFQYSNISIFYASETIGSSQRYLSDLPLILDIFMNMGLAGIIFYSFNLKDFKSAFKVGIILIPFLLFAFILGRRSIVLPLLLAPLLIIFIKTKLLSRNRILFLITILFLISTILLTLRYYFEFELFNNPNAIPMAVERSLFTHVKEAEPLIISFDKYGIYGGEHWLFSTWWEWIYDIIPRFLWENKPTRISADKYIARIFYGYHDLRMGTPNTLLGTTYMSGGILLLTISSFCLGVIAKFIDNLGQMARSNDKYLFYYILFYISFVVFFFRLGDFSTSLIQVVITFSFSMSSYFLILFIQKTHIKRKFS